MSYRGSEKTQATSIMLRRLGHGGALRGPGSLPGGRSFEEELALFERQAREEAGERGARLEGRDAGAAFSA